MHGANIRNGAARAAEASLACPRERVPDQRSAEAGARKGRTDREHVEVQDATARRRLAGDRRGWLQMEQMSASLTFDMVHNSKNLA